MPLLRRWRPAPVETADEFAEFLAAQAAFVSQKSTVEYCRARAGLNWDKLFREEAFLEAMERCRWEAFALVLADLSVVAEGYLRPCATDREWALAEALAATYAAILAGHPVPVHRPQGWNDEVEDCRARLARAQLGAPKPPQEVAKHAGGKVYDLLPIHRSLRGHDYELVRNSIRFNLVRSFETMTQRVKAGPVVLDLLGPAPEPEDESAPAGGETP